jgi:NodT family efflux transporter outer membrane factor (OMF) lipoprotein
MRWVTRIGLLSLVLTASACATLTNLKSTTSDEQIAQVSIQSISDVPDRWQAAQTTIGSVQIGWIEALGDDTLTGLVKEAQANNRNLQAAALNVEWSWALARQAGVALRPNVGFSSGANRQVFIDGPIPDSAGINWGLQTGWEIDVWGRIKAGQKAAIASAQSTEADYRFTQHSIAAAVANAYFIGLEAALQAQVALQTLDTLSETNRVVNVQYAEGMAMAQDVALSASDLASTRASLIAAEGSFRDALKALEVLVGRYPAGELEIREALPAVPTLPAAGLPSQLLERRPDVIAAERTVAASFYALDQARVANLPRLSLSANTGGNSSQLLNIFDPKNILINIASSVTAPVFDAGLNKFQIEQAEIEQKQAVASYAQTALTAFQEVETSLNQMQVVEARANALREAASQSDQALNIAMIRYNEGETDLLDMLTIQQRVFNAQSALVSAERARLDNWIDLNLALGGHW